MTTLSLNKPLEKRDKEYGYRTIKRVFALIFALMVIGVFIVPTVVLPGHFTSAGYVVAAIWLMVLVAGTTWTCRVQYRYRCPQCGAHLPPLPTDASTRRQHRFHCSACDVIWTTDIYGDD